MVIIILIIVFLFSIRLNIFQGKLTSCFIVPDAFYLSAYRRKRFGYRLCTLIGDAGCIISDADYTNDDVDYIIDVVVCTMLLLPDDYRN